MFVQGNTLPSGPGGLCSMNLTRAHGVLGQRGGFLHHVVLPLAMGRGLSSLLGSVASVDQGMFSGEGRSCATLPTSTSSWGMGRWPSEGDLGRDPRAATSVLLHSHSFVPQEPFGNI